MTASFRERLDAIAQRAGLAAYEAGVAAGLSKGTVNQWMRKGAPSGNVSYLLKFADHYKVSLDWLTGRSEHGGPDDPELATRRQDTLQIARRAAMDLSFELNTPLPELWQAAFHATAYKANLDEMKRAIRRALPDAPIAAAEVPDEATTKELAVAPGAVHVGSSPGKPGKRKRVPAEPPSSKRLGKRHAEVGAERADDGVKVLRK